MLIKKSLHKSNNKIRIAGVAGSCPQDIPLSRKTRKLLKDPRSTVALGVVALFWAVRMVGKIKVSKSPDIFK